MSQQATIMGMAKAPARERAAEGSRLPAAVRAVMRTDAGLGPVLLRLTLAAVIFPHGAQKVLGWFGGYGFEGTMGFFSSMGIPALFGVLAIAAEFLGPIGLATGLLTRVAALGVASVMAVSMLMVHAANGFFMNWFGNQAGEGIEYHLLALGMSVAVMVMGGGSASADRALAGGRDGR
jgi:putative oxidoreductase